MERIWLDNYPDGVPAEIDPDACRSLAELFHTSVERFRERPAYTNMGRTLTFGEVEQLSRDFAAYLQNHLGLRKGDRLALMLPNVLQYPVALFGAFRAGLTVVNVNPLYTPAELRHQLRDSGAVAMLVLETCAHTLQACLADTPVRHVLVTSIGELLGFPKGAVVDLVVRRVKKLVPPWRLPGAVPLRRALRAGRGLPLEPVELVPEDLAFLQYTGGTTGVSKGAMLTHRNMVANVLQARAWVLPFVVEGEEVIITALPLYHIFSLTANCLTWGSLGGLNVLITNPRDFPGFVKELGKHRFTAMTGVSTLFNRLLHDPGFARLDLRSLRLTLGGGMAVQAAVAERWQEVTGRPLLEAYGLTETSPAATINPLNLERYNGTIGLPLPSTEVEIRDDAGASLPLGEVGEICIRGPQVMKGYWQRPEETALVLGADGFLATGDVGRLEEGGYVRVVDRKKDMILVSGFNVYPNEIEDVAAHHPGVLEVAAVGVPSDTSGEVVKLFVVKKDPALTAEALIAHCRVSLAGYKVPKLVEFRDELPKTSVGKVLRRALKEESASRG
ncbi:MAG: AMP-binding protein [Deferrisomatales bacterium]|nr:AMP-binding protein [Deferrisomatales bacterium]